MKFDHTHYVPCLRWKMGEYQAVMRLSSGTKDHLTPLIEVPEIGYDFATRRANKTLDKHLEKFASRVRAKWQKRPCFVDGRLLLPNAEMASGEHAMQYVFSGLRSGGCPAIPVTAPGGDAQYQSAIRQIVSTDSQGVCVRVSLEQAARSDFKNSADDLVIGMGLNYGEAHLVLDLDAPNFTPVEGFSKLVQNVIRGLPKLDQWGTVTVLGTSFPKTMAEVKTSPALLTRSEWVLYKNVVNGLQTTGDRVPTFGDYAIQHPDVLPLDMRLVRPYASIRYSIDDAWYIIRGLNVRDNGFGQYREHCSALLSSPYYAGAGYSLGDKYIADCAGGAEGTGNLTTWRCVGTNHHLERVVRDIASFFGSSGAP